MNSKEATDKRIQGLMTKLRGVNKAVEDYLEGRLTAEEVLSKIAGYDVDIGPTPFNIRGDTNE